MTGKIFLKLIAGLVLVLLLALVTVDYNASEVAGDTYRQSLVRAQAEKCRLLAITLGEPGALDPARIHAEALALSGRITVVRSDGKVLADSDANAAEMENHRTRPEFIHAFAGEVGSDERLSATLKVPFLYVAVPAQAGAVRVAVPLAEVTRQVEQIRWKILGATALAFLPAFLIAALIARFLSGRFASIMSHAVELARGNFRSRLKETGGSEFRQLSSTLNETAVNLQANAEALEREHAELEKLERVRKDFVINVSHELRTPLASIQGYTETLMDGALSDPEHNMRFLGIIRHNSERLARITEDLLTISRIEQKKRKFEFEPHPVNGLLEDSLDLIRPIASKSQLMLEMEPAPEDAVAWCDSEAVSQILSNLLDNAIKYTPAGGRITVGARIVDSHAELYVRDTGIGIPSGELHRLFERFYRVDKARSREMGGTGLGLSIVKHLVAAHDGTTRVESSEGQGSAFYFTIALDRSVFPNHRLNPEFIAP